MTVIQTSRGLVVALLAFGAGVASATTPFAQGVPPRMTTAPQQPARDAPAVPTVGTASIVGQVIQDDDSGRPIRRATVNLNSPNARMPRVTMTDDAGRFAFVDLPPGPHNLNVSKPAYVSAFYRAPGARGTGSSMITLAAGQRQDVVIRMARGAVITGTIRDAQGLPIAGQRVQVIQVRQDAGLRRQTTQRSSQNPTDDQGRYRVYGLAPGDYLVAIAPPQSAAVPLVTEDEIQWARQQAGAIAAGIAMPPPARGPTMGFASLFYPGTTNQTHATVITLAAGEERAGIDLALEPVVLARVTGVVLTPEGTPPPPASLQLARPQSGGPALPTNFNAGARSDQGGRFTFTNVPPGQYVITVRIAGRGVAPPAPPPPPGSAGGEAVVLQSVRSAQAPAPMLWGLVDVIVNGADIGDVPVTLQRGLEISGRVVFEGSAPTADLARTRISTQPVQTGVGNPLSVSVPPATVNPDGTFVLRGATPGRYTLSANAPVAAPPAGSAPNARPTPAPTPPPGASPGSTLTPPPAGWTLKSVVANGAEVLDFPLELLRDDVRDVIVTFSDKRADLEGTLVDRTGKPAADYSVLVFSADRALWSSTRRVRTARTSAEGRYRLTALPPGEYYLVTVADLAQFDWKDPAILDQLTGAGMKFTIAEGEKKVQDLRIAG